MKSSGVCHLDLYGESPPSRGAWIEIRAVLHGFKVRKVAPLAGGVD